MKQILYIITLFIVPVSLYGQSVKKVTIKNSFPSTKEVFYVLKSNEEVRQGLYTKSLRGAKLSSGNYENGKRKGIWDYYDNNGNISQKVDYDMFSIISGQDKSKGPTALGGMSQLYRLIQHTMMYPANARIKGTQGKVIVKFEINEEGEMENFTITSSVGDGCDEEAIRTLKQTGFEWFPATDESDKPIRSDVELPITFLLG